VKTAATSMPAAPAAPTGKAFVHFRWGICGLLFFATTVNYIDRQVIGLLKPVLEKDLGWREADYGWIVFAFQAAYAAVMPLAGRFIDAMGVRLGYLIAVDVWLCPYGHALAANAMEFGIARFALGLGESANFPAALKTRYELVPAPGARTGHGSFQQRSQYRRGTTGGLRRARTGAEQSIATSARQI
jgi:ACS family hexuronate transporter-like MFS transporter